MTNTFANNVVLVSKSFTVTFHIEENLKESLYKQHFTYPQDYLILVEKFHDVSSVEALPPVKRGQKLLEQGSLSRY